MAPIATEILRADALARHFTTHSEVVKALDGVSFAIERGEVVALVGPSASGKSTLLNIIGGLERPTGGALWFGDRNLADMSSRELAAYRRLGVGMVFQSFNLIARMTAVENVMLPLTLEGALPPRERAERATGLLDAVGLGARADHRPTELSGGEQQRVAIARALANQPDLLLADEPTGNLDSSRAAELLDLLLALNRDRGQTLLIVTHDEKVAGRAHRQLRMQDGRLVA